jgi:hypothetical protein
MPRQNIPSRGAQTRPPSPLLLRSTRAGGTPRRRTPTQSNARHKFFKRKRGTRTCITCGCSWQRRANIDFECHPGSIYTQETLPKKPHYFVDQKFLAKHGFFPIQEGSLPYPGAFLLTRTQGGEYLPTSFYDLRKITPDWEQLLQEKDTLSENHHTARSES